MTPRGTAVLLAAAALWPVAANAITRDEVMTRARAYAYHPWRATAANETASCSGSYRSVYRPGDYLGLPYDWGGYMTLWEFDQQIAQGYGAGSYPDDGILACTSGVDCSGYVSKTWGTSHYTTRSLPNISTSIAASSVLPGDIFNLAGYHVVLYSHRLANGTPVFYESIGFGVHVNPWGGWSHVSDYTPLRYRNITGATATDPLGTPTNPIPITSLPFSDTRDTRNSPSSVLDRCGAAPDRNESGPEYVYRVTLTQPGQLTVSVSDDATTDVDVHLYESMNMSDCTARHDRTFTKAVDCGTYYVVADTFGSGLTNAGPYNLTVTFAPSEQPCGTGPRRYDFAGEPGDACAYPGHPDLPSCNPTLGADTCLYTSTTSFCSMPCSGPSDCGAMPGGCCREIAPGERYCMPSSRCASADGGVAASTPDAGPPRDIDDVPDAGGPDAGVADAGVPDAGVADAGLADAGLADAGLGDAGVADAGLADAGADVHTDAGTSSPDAGVGPAASSGGCQAGGGAASLPWALALLWVARARRRRHERSGTPIGDQAAGLAPVRRPCSRRSRWAPRHPSCATSRRQKSCCRPGEPSA